MIHSRGPPVSSNASKLSNSSLQADNDSDELNGTLEILALAGRNLRNTELFGKMDPFLIFQIDYIKRRTRAHVGGGRNPSWNQRAVIEIIPGRRKLSVRCMDKDLISDDLVGLTEIDLSDLVGREVVGKRVRDDWFPIFHPKKNKPAGEIRLCLTFQPEIADNDDDNEDEGIEKETSTSVPKQLKTRKEETFSTTSLPEGLESSLQINEMSSLDDGLASSRKTSSVNPQGETTEYALMSNEDDDDNAGPILPMFESKPKNPPIVLTASATPSRKTSVSEPVNKPPSPKRSAPPVPMVTWNQQPQPLADNNQLLSVSPEPPQAVTPRRKLSNAPQKPLPPIPQDQSPFSIPTLQVAEPEGNSSASKYKPRPPVPTPSN